MPRRGDLPVRCLCNIVQKLRLYQEIATALWASQ